MTELATAPPPPTPPASSQTIDFGRPFRFVFEDPDWVKKIVIGGLFYLAGMLLIGLPFVFGYLVQLARNVIRGDARPLPEWDRLGDFFIDGLKIIVIGFVYLLPPLLLMGLVVGGSALVGGLEEEELAGPFAGLFGCFIAIFIVLILIYSVFMPAALLMYVGTGSMGEAFNVKRIVSFVLANPGNYILAYVIYLVANFLSQFGIVLFCIGVFLTAFWSMVVAAYAFADAYRLARVR